MPLTQQQITLFSQKAKAAGLNDSQIQVAIAKKEAEMQASGVVPTTKTVVTPPVTNLPDPMAQKDSQGNIITNTVKAIVDPALKYGAFVGEAAAQGLRAVVDPIGSTDEMEREIGKLTVQNNSIIARMKSEKDPKKKELLGKVSRELSAQIEEVGNKAREIGDKKQTFVMQDPTAIADRGKILEAGVKRTAGAAAYAVPMGSGVKATLALGGTAGALSGFGSSEGESIIEAAKDTAMGAAGGVVGAAVLPLAGSLLRDGKTAGNRVLNKMLNPFTSQYDDEIVKLATSKGVDLPVSARTKSNTVKQLEAWSQKSFFGGKVTERIIKARDEVDALSQELTNKLAKDIDKKSIGEAVKKGFGEFEDSFNKTKTSLYNSVPKSVATTEADAASTIKALQEIIESKEKSAAPNTNVEYYKTILKNITKGKKVESTTPQIFGVNGEVLNAPPAYKPTYEILRKTRTTLGEKLKNFSDPIATGDKASLQKVYATLSDDMEQTIKATDENAYKMFETANEFYKQGITKINSSVGKTIKNADPEKLVDTLIKPNSETDIALVKSMLDSEGISKLQEGFTSKIYNQSLDSSQMLDVKKLRANLDKYGESSIKELLGDEGFTKFTQTVADLEDIDKLKQAIQRGAKPAEGSQTAFLLNSFLTAGSWAISPVAFAAKVGGDYALPKMFTSEAGQKFLTEGLGEIVQKTGVQLSSPIEQIASRLLALQGSRMFTGVETVGQVPDQQEASGSSEITQSPNNTQNTNNGNELNQLTSPMGVNNADIISQGSNHPIPKFRQFANKDQMVAKAFADGLGTKDVQELVKLWDAFAPQSSSVISPEVNTLLEQRSVLNKAGVSTKSIDAKLAQYGFEPAPQGTELSATTENRVQLAVSGLRYVTDIEKMIADDPQKIFLQALPGQLGARDYDSAAFKAVEGLLRARSGAAVPPEEVRSYMRANLPRVGDSEETINYKLRTFKQDLTDVSNSGGVFNAQDALGM